jgi:hypothetical protein
VDSVPTVELATADDADNIVDDGNAEGDNRMVGQWERRLGRSSERELK